MTYVHPEILARFRTALANAKDEIALLENPNKVSYPLGTISEAAAHFAAREEFGFTYGRTGTPAGAILERFISTLEGGTSAVAVASGQAANFLVFQSLLPKIGDEIVASSRVFGGTSSLLKSWLPSIGRTAKLADPLRSENFEREITEKTRAIFVETVSNPDGTVADIEKLAVIAQRYKIPLIVDNTLAPLLARPIEWGANIVTLSLTKFFNGKGDLVAGSVIDAGNFKWQDDTRWPALSAHRANDVSPLAKVFNNKAFAALIRQNLTLFGPALNPADALKIIENASDLDTRLERHSENAYRVAEFLGNHEQVEWVHFLGDKGHPSHDLSQQYLSAPPAILLFKPKGGVESANKLLQSFETIKHEANIGYAGSLAIHSFDTTHRLFTPEQKEAARIEQGALRLSLGIENPNILTSELDVALQNISEFAPKVA